MEQVSVQGKGISFVKCILDPCVKARLILSDGILCQGVARQSVEVATIIPAYQRKIPPGSQATEHPRNNRIPKMQGLSRFTKKGDIARRIVQEATHVCVLDSV